MEVKLLWNTSLEVADKAIAKCYGKEPYEELEKQQGRINRVANVSKHSSTIEHLEFSFDIDGISRACLQELARHRLFSFTVKSSRYTLQELKKENFFCSYVITPEGNLHIYGSEEAKERAREYVMFTGDNGVDINTISALELLRQEVVKGTKNDVSKYCMPEAYLTSLVITGNARVLQNFLQLRTDSHALKEIQILAHKIYEAIPETHKFLFTDYVQGEINEK